MQLETDFRYMVQVIGGHSEMPGSACQGRPVRRSAGKQKQASGRHLRRGCRHTARAWRPPHAACGSGPGTSGRPPGTRPGAAPRAPGTSRSQTRPAAARDQQCQHWHSRTDALQALAYLFICTCGWGGFGTPKCFCTNTTQSIFLHRCVVCEGCGKLTCMLADGHSRQQALHTSLHA